MTSLSLLADKTVGENYLMLIELQVPISHEETRLLLTLNAPTKLNLENAVCLCCLNIVANIYDEFKKRD